MSNLVLKTYDEVKKYVGSDVNNEFETIKPYLNDAVRDFVIPFLGQAEYNSLFSAYDTDQLTTDNETILPIVQNIIVNFGYYTFADDGTMSITDSGFIRQEHTEGKSAYQWQVRNFKERRWLNGYMAIEALIQHLNKNAGNYTSWFACDERKTYNKIFVWNTSIFRNYHRINSYGTLFQLLPNLKEMEAIVIAPLLTDELYNEMLTRLLEGATTEDDVALLPYIQRTIVFGALAEIAENFGYEFGINGLQASLIDSTSQNSDKKSDVVQRSREILKTEFTQKFDKARNLLTNYLNANASDSKYTPYYTKYLTNTTTATDNNDTKGLTFFGF